MKPEDSYLTMIPTTFISRMEANAVNQNKTFLETHVP